MSNAPTSPCAECGMSVHIGEYHPYAACLMYKACKDSTTVRLNLNAVRENVVIANLEAVIADYEATSDDGEWGDPHPIYLMAKEVDRWRHIQPEPVGFVDAEGNPQLSRRVTGGYLYHGYAPK